MTPTVRTSDTVTPPAPRLARRRGVGPTTHVRRYAEIAAILVRYGFVDVVDALHLRGYLAAGRRLLALVGRPVQPDAPRAVRLRLAFEALGPTFIKFGQALSLRTDLLPPDVVAQLALLQDAAPPLPPGAAERAIEAALGQPAAALFASFDGTPLAAASMAQVHRATLPSGDVVAVKVRRPGLEEVIEADLGILADLARLADRHWPDAELYCPSSLVAEFGRAIRREQDFVREGRLLDRMASQFAGDPTVHFPRVCWPLSRSSVLTMEFLDGVKVTDLGEGRDAVDDRRLVARRGADAVLRQILVHGLFHGDPHPGNLLVLPGGVVAFFDLGIVGRLNREMRGRLAEVVVAIHSLWGGGLS
jgi:ubiquinone biosynthesis protein